MAIVSNITKEPQEEQVVREAERAVATCGKGKRDKSTVLDSMATLESRLGKVELTVTDHHDYWDELDQRMEQLDYAELREDMQGALNEAVDQLLKGNDAIRELVESLHIEVIQLKRELKTCKVQLAQDASVTMGKSSVVRMTLQNSRPRLMRYGHKEQEVRL